MNLTAGATLQHGKYQIQAVLEQNDWTVTYQALHLGLAQTVVIQSLNFPVRIYPDPDQVLSSVRQRLNSPIDPQINVLEYFIEAEMLFVVLQPGKISPVPNLHNWINSLANFQPTPSTPALPSELPDVIPTAAIAPYETAATWPILESNSLEPNSLDSDPPDSNTPDSNTLDSSTHEGHNTSSSDKTTLQPVVTTLQEPTPLASTPQPKAPTHTIGNQSNHGQNGYTSTKPRLPGSSPTGYTAPNSNTQTKVTVLNSQTKRGTSKLWIPLALGLTSLAAGLAGASFGWVLRTHNLNSTNNPSLLSPILNNEQSFPSIEGWVGDDPVDLSTPLTIPEEFNRPNRRRSVNSVYSEQERFSEDVPTGRSPLRSQEPLEETPLLDEPLDPLPETTDDIGADPQPYVPSEPNPAPTTEFVPLPPKIKPDPNPPETYQPAPPPSDPVPVALPNVNGALSNPDAQ